MQLSATTYKNLFKELPAGKVGFLPKNKNIMDVDTFHKLLRDEFYIVEILNGKLITKSSLNYTFFFKDVRVVKGDKYPQLYKYVFLESVAKNGKLVCYYDFMSENTDMGYVYNFPCHDKLVGKDETFVASLVDNYYDKHGFLFFNFKKEIFGYYLRSRFLTGKYDPPVKKLQYNKMWYD